MSNKMAKENYFVAARRTAIQNVKEIISRSGKKGVDAAKFVASMMLLGYREKTLNEYLDVLQRAGFIRYEGAAVKRWFIVSEAHSNEQPTSG